MKIPQSVIDQCQEKLLQLKAELINRYQSARLEFSGTEIRGDEIDNSVSLLAENNFLLSQERIRNQLLEIEYALARIEQGQFGICEETDEAIECERLLAIPWTRLSIEGAEIREDLKKRFAR